jgi:hypothetical protein
MDKDKCLELLEEYHILRRKLEISTKLTGDKSDTAYARKVEFDKDDEERLQEIKEILGSRCLAYLPEQDIENLKADKV